MRRVVVLVVAAVGLGGVCTGGCATGNSRRDKQIAEIGGRPAEPPPPGGWANYKPERYPYGPDPVGWNLAPSTVVGSDTN